MAMTKNTNLYELTQTVIADFMVSIKRIGVSDDVIIVPSSGETIEGYDRVRLRERAARITLITDGTNWYEFDSKENTVYSNCRISDFYRGIIHAAIKYLYIF